MKSLASLSSFVRGYLTAAFWTNDDAAPSGEYTATSRPEEMFAKLSEDSLALAIVTCRNFCDVNERWLESAGNDEQNGHDLWLTRTGQGCGFWDRGYSDDVSDALTAAAHRLGESDLHEGDDGKLYLSR